MKNCRLLIFIMMLLAFSGCEEVNGPGAVAIAYFEN